VSVTREGVERRLYAACNTLLKHDRALLELDANERSITHKLAEHLQREFPGWHVDCEYNHKGETPKLLSGVKENVSTDDTCGRTVFPDIIVHHRGTDENLLVIEAKKSITVDGSEDEEKLKAYEGGHEYRFAFTVVFPVGSRASEVDPSIDIAEVTE